MPFWPPNVFSSGARREAAVLLVLLELDRDPRAGLGAGVPRPEGLEIGGGARHAAGEGELDGALDRALAGLVRPADDRHAGRQVDVELAIAAQVADLEPPDPHSDTSWPASRSRPSRSASRSSAASAAGSPTPSSAGVASSSAMRASRSRMNAPAIVSGGGQRALGQRRQADVADADLEERRGERRSRSPRGGGRARPGGRRRSGHRGRGRGQPFRARLSMRAGWVVTPAASRSSFSNRVLPTWCSVTVTLRPAACLLELDEEHLAGPVLVEGDGLRGAGVGVGDAAGLALLRRMPVAEGEVVETARADLVGRDDDVVAIGLAGDRDRPVDHRRRATSRRPFCPATSRSLQRAVRRALGREDRAVDDDVAGRRGGCPAWSGVRTVTQSSSGVLPARAFRS